MGSQFTVDVVIDLAQGSRNQYRYDREFGTQRLERVLSLASTCKADYGHVPNTTAEDGNELRALVLINGPVSPGCIVESKVVGLLQQNSKDKDGQTINVILCAAIVDPEFANVETGADIPSEMQRDILFAVSLYHDSHEESVQGFELQDREAGLRVLHESIARFSP